MRAGIVGWDIGGAHVKAALLAGDGRPLAWVQLACPLWLGLEQLEQTVPQVLAELAAPAGCLHAVTMTGELVDAFASREEGVQRIVDTLLRLLEGASVQVFAGPSGLLDARRLDRADCKRVASANWLASAALVARSLPAALFVDMGSTTTDILLVGQGTVHYRGYSDYERLRQEELVYTGAVRTPVMAVAERAPFDGDMILLAAEHFATMADVYRLCGQLPDNADQWPAADGGEKTVAGSARRLARMVGRDLGADALAPWRQLAIYLRERQLEKLHGACLRQLSRGILDPAAPVVGAGVGRFLVRRLAERLERPYVDMADVLGTATSRDGLTVADVAPAVAVANLAKRSDP